jgi:ADP-heptose:LPS heptosyltransferase
VTNKVVYLLEVKGTLAELRELFGEGVKSELRKEAKAQGVKTVKRAKKRAKSAWQKYISQKKNQIKFKSGSKKGLLNMKAMSRAFKKTRAGRKKR